MSSSGIERLSAFPARSRAPGAILALVIALCPLACAERSPERPEDRASRLIPVRHPALAQRGRLLFRARCARCHGEDGSGNGPLAAKLAHPPADLRRGRFKSRSTPMGSVPSDPDILRTLIAGIPGSGMEGEAGLSDRDLWALAGRLKELVPDWREREENSTPASHFPPRPLRYRPEDGKKAWRQLKCWECHGPTGKGDGPSALSFTDEQGRPVKVVDLTSMPSLKFGERAEDIFRTISTGLEGTPMPSFREAASESMLWDVAGFVLELRAQAGKHPGPK